MAASHQRHYRSPFGDTTLTKIFVGGLAWETPTQVMRAYFEQFGDILEAVIINDKATGKSKGYGFVTFRDPESATRACADPNPVIDGRRANCNIASLGRPHHHPSPSRGRSQVGSSQQGGGGGSPFPPLPPLPLPPPVMYRPYGYSSYTHDYGYHQTMYGTGPQSQQYNQLYGAPSPPMGSPYFYGYTLQPAARGPFSPPPPPPPSSPQRFHAPSYLYFHSIPPETSTSAFPPPIPLPPRLDSTSPIEDRTDGEAAGGSVSSTTSAGC